MNPLNFVRLRDRDLSLWQSAVENFIRIDPTAKKPPLSKREALAHPLSIATAHYVSARYNDKDHQPAAPPKDDGSHDAWVYKSYLGHSIGEAIVANNKDLVKELEIKYRQFSDEDYSVGPPPTGFLTCPVTYAKYAILSGNHMTYNDWTVAGNNNINYGVIDWKLPNNATVAILGDWGTGLDDAIELLKYVVAVHKPDAIIHLGDIYYSGTPEECHHYFADVFTNVFNEVNGGQRIPVFSMPGNHDYYAWGTEYYYVVTGLNSFLPSAVQPASYFCLRSEDNGWQFLAMDTGYHDSNPADQKNPVYAGPWLEDSEIQWHRDKMDNFNGNTILLSHHQLYSSNTAINGRDSVMNASPYFNAYLYRVFGDYIPSKTAAWIWGHEHNFVMYRTNIAQLTTGRLLGNSAYEELTSADPYAVNYPQVPYLVDDYDKYKLHTNQDTNGVTYYNHGYGIISLANRNLPTDPVQATWYEFPAWGDIKPANPVANVIYSEPLQVVPEYNAGSEVYSGYNYYLTSQDGMTVRPAYSGVLDWYPNLLPGTYDTAILLTASEVHETGQALVNGDMIALQTTESKIVPGSNLLTYSANWLTYSNTTGNDTLWRIHKRNNVNDPVIHIGDTFYLESVSHPGYYIKPNYAKKWSLIYLTTDTGEDCWWRFNAME